jgi:hypothetical protein
MAQPQNGQSQSEPEKSKPRGRFTGQRLLRERPRVYRRVVELLADPGISINQITKLCQVSEHTVRAVRDREAIPIAERKQRLVSILGNVAEISAERMEELAPGATLRDAGIAAGISIDKLMLLLGESGGVPVQVSVAVNAQLVHERFAQWTAALEKETESAENKESLPNGETLSEPPAGMDSQSGEQNLQR